MGLVCTSGQMEGVTRESGRTTTCMGEVFIHGKMGGGMKESTCMIRNMGMESISGQMEGHIKVSGRMANKMGRGCIGRITGERRKAFGKGERGLSGLSEDIRTKMK